MTYFKILVLGVLLLFLHCLNNTIWAQSDSMQIFRQEDMKKFEVSYFNFSKPDKFNFEIIVLGGVKQPGIYKLPEGTTILELVALTGGAIDESILDNFKLIRPKSKNPDLKADTIIIISYKDFFDKDKIGSFSKRNPLLRPGDIIAFPIKPDKDFWDVTSKIATILVIPLISIATLIVTIMNFNK